MTAKETRPLRGRSLFNKHFAVALLATTTLGGALAYADPVTFFFPGNLLLSRSVYDATPADVTVGMTLPPNCVPNKANKVTCVTAVNDGTYPFVFNNAPVDASFGITTKILLDEILPIPTGNVVQTIEVPNNTDPGVTASKDQMVTSFSSKSEIGLNLSLDRSKVSFMGYLSPVGAVDVSNSNTPDVVDPTNPVPSADYRVIADLDQFGQFHFTKTNAYSGNNGRAAILNNVKGANVHYMSGNAGNGGKPQPVGVITGAGAQISTPSNMPLSLQPDPGAPTPLGSFSIAEVGDAADKVGKDTNFRGLTVFNNVVYLTKGSGGNGINTVYFIDTTGNVNPASPTSNPKACPNGSGVPAPGATLPTTGIVFNGATVQADGVTPFNMCVLNGFPTSLAANTTPPLPMFPFGMFFANATTLYVADEGNDDTTFANGIFTNTATQTTTGLQKWVLNTQTNTWSLAYTLQAGLQLGVPYIVPGYPTGINAATGLPWAPATGGLRNITGRVNPDGTVSIWAITSTVSGGGDQGADPNRLVLITDRLAATTLSAHESFTTVRTAKSGEVLRGISFTPGTGEGLAQEISSLLCDFGICQ
jgi:hypothetical protein